MKLTTLGLRKHELTIGDRRGLFSHDVLVAVVGAASLTPFVLDGLYRQSPAMQRHVEEWVLTIPSKPEPVAVSTTRLHEILEGPS